MPQRAAQWALGAERMTDATTATPLDSLFAPLQIGALTLPNRVVMAPLTRARASADNVPQPVMAQYYAQRADCGLIVTEATAVDPLGMGWYRVPGIWTDEQMRAWRRVGFGRPLPATLDQADSRCRWTTAATHRHARTGDCFITTRRPSAAALINAQNLLPCPCRCPLGQRESGSQRQRRPGFADSGRLL